ncbi:zinc-binding dehydrogenase [Prosthecomicrobium pneumaticum]|uniref:NADPH:quinone reductase-like Zn-dependent oxidoreductase n=1 Tax=Prosthecomicrobium pneumaticum TaxID=81895 RepID=A0A7W9FQM8_9HYPH|nr:zinc-binding dehydrogenase [Prosthecomicrobium pneumaticum]MBB5755098.1 NADPH:quinone reductase-like Zn-dependent oxidoreductase [Prosthecomicrobium pneumaticum]
MKAIVVPRSGGGLDSVALAELPMPEPGPGEVRLRVEAVSLNPVDWKLAVSGHPRWTFPHVLGLDAAGTVDAVGPGATAWRTGDRAVFHGNLSKAGVFAEYAIAPEHVLSRVPDGVPAEAAAALPCAGYTAYQALFRKVKIEAGQTVLVQGANGGVGGFAVQLAATAGARVIGLARAEHHAAVRRLGAETVLDYRDADLAPRIRALTEGGHGVDVMIEVANPGDARTSFAFIHYNGHLVSIDPLPNLAEVKPYTHAISVHEVALGGAYLAGHTPTERDFARMGDDLLARLAAGSLDPMIEERIDMAAIPDALGRLRCRAVTGKIVARIAA